MPDTPSRPHSPRSWRLRPATGQPSAFPAERFADCEDLSSLGNLPLIPIVSWAHQPPDTASHLSCGHYLQKNAAITRVLLDALAYGRPVYFTYGDILSPLRCVTPTFLFTIANFDPPYYFTGYCHHSQAARTFRYDKMRLRTNPANDHSPFIPPPPPPTFQPETYPASRSY